MNCTECGNALLLDRVIFRCSCGAYVHAYCADKHIVHAHRPEFQEGFVDLNGDFHLKKEPVVVAELPAEVEEESPEVVETSPDGEEGEKVDEKVEEKDEDIATVTETPAGGGEVEAGSSESEKPDASSE